MPVVDGLGRPLRDLRVSVTDHGPGIPEKFRPQVFKRFAQADTSDSRRKGGTGLGLSICRLIIEKLDGEIGFQSTPNVATTFFIDLPELRQTQRVEAPEQEALEAPQPSRMRGA